ASLDPSPTVEVNERRIGPLRIARLVHVKLRIPIVRGEIGDVGHHPIVVVDVQGLRELFRALRERRRPHCECDKYGNGESELSHRGVLQCERFRYRNFIKTAVLTQRVQPTSVAGLSASENPGPPSTLRAARYWITSSAVANSVSGMVRPRAL